MKKKQLILFTFLYSFIVFSQEKTIKGIVTDSLKNPIQYVNVGVLNKPLGTLTNASGEFILNVDSSMNLDTLKISCLGYKSKEMKVESLINNKSEIQISLANYIEKLDEVVITSGKLKMYNEGKEKTKTSASVIFANPNYVNQNLGSEIGRKFSLGTKKPSILTHFKFFIRENNFELVKFRINIYSINNNRPVKKLFGSNIIVDVNNKGKGWVNVDLTKYDIKTQEDIIVTVEWLEGSKDGSRLNLPIIIPSLGSTHYYKFGSQAKWQKYSNLSSSMILSYKQ
ncbi:hypothetical protein D3C72_407200 [compost metagenome]